MTAIHFIVVPPSPPKNVIGELTDQSQPTEKHTLSIMWTEGEDGNSEILRHHLYYAIKDQDSDWVMKTIPSNQHSFRIVNITGSVVFFKMASENGVGIGEFSKTYQFDIIRSSFHRPLAQVTLMRGVVELKSVPFYLLPWKRIRLDQRKWICGTKQKSEL